VIETERLLLRPLTMADLDELVTLHADPRVERFMGGFDRPGIIEWIGLAADDWATYGYGRAAIVDRGSGRLLGRSGLKRWPQFEETEVGWVLRPDAWGQGLATEAARAWLAWGFENLDLPYLTAMIHPDNAPSMRVAERLGMAPIRSDTLLGDPAVVYAVTREAWAKTQM
jgi:RimJ/RimL family protein N-acetyltransferase